jgi:hypothetical protein
MPQFRCPQVGFFRRVKGGVLGFSMLAWSMAGSVAWGQQQFALTPLDANPTTAYATFTSHNQKVVVNQYGIFVSYLHQGNLAMDQTQWRLERSVDGGATFTRIDESPYPSADSTYPPTLETDRAGNIYMIRSQSGAWPGHAYLRVYSASTNFAPPSVEPVIMWGASEKFSMLLDEARGRIYYVAQIMRIEGTPPDDAPHPLWFYMMSLDGTPLHHARLTRRCIDDPNLPPNDDPCKAGLSSSYPHLALDEQGVLYVAWTNVDGTQSSDYEHRSSHVMKSDDGGVNWKTLTGAAVTLPVVADRTGPITMINDDNAAELAGSKFLWTMRAKQGKLHFAYRNTDTAQRYVRFDIATGQKDINLTGWGGETLQLDGLDGFCTTSTGADHTLYCVGRMGNSPADWDRLAVLASYDNGQTWHDYASTGHLGIRPYTITGAREIRDGSIVGMFILPRYVGDDPNRPQPVHFFSVPVQGRLRTAGVTTNVAATGYPATHAIDGNPQTQWVASLNPNNVPGNNNAWIQIDLGGVGQLNRIRWKAAAWTPYPAQAPADYTIAVSPDGANWTTVVTRTNPYGIIDGDEPVNITGRYVKLTTTKVSDGSGWSLSFHEFWAEGLALPPTRLPATTGGFQTPGYETAKAVDGRYDTLHIWSLTPVPQNNVGWVQLSFGSIRSIARVKWVAANGWPYPASAPKDYVIQVSNDGSNWTTVVSRSAPNLPGILLGNETIGYSARHLRILTSQVNDGTGWSLGLWEFWAEGW